MVVTGMGIQGGSSAQRGVRGGEMSGASQATAPGCTAAGSQLQGPSLCRSTGCVPETDPGRQEKADGELGAGPGVLSGDTGGGATSEAASCRSPPLPPPRAAGRAPPRCQGLRVWALLFLYQSDGTEFSPSLHNPRANQIVLGFQLPCAESQGKNQPVSGAERRARRWEPPLLPQAAGAPFPPAGSAGSLEPQQPTLSPATTQRFVPAGNRAPCARRFLRAQQRAGSPQHRPPGSRARQKL